MAKLQRRGRRQGAKRPETQGGPAAPLGFLFGRPGRPFGPPRPPNAAAPRVSAPAFLRPRATAVRPPEARCRRVGGRRGGARRGGGWTQPTRPLPGKARQRARSGALPRCAAAPAGRWEHVPAMRSIRRPFPSLFQPAKLVHRAPTGRAGAAALGMGRKQAE